MASGVIAGYPVEGVRVTLFDGSYHSVDSSEMAFKVAGSMAFKQAMESAKPVLLEPIMTISVSVPEDSVGDVIGDLNSRRGRPLGMEPKGGATEIKAEVPMAEILSYAPDLRPITGGRGDYTMELARYEEVPAHLAGKVVEKARAAKEAAVQALRRLTCSPVTSLADEEGASPVPRPRDLRRLRPHDSQGRAHRVLPRAWR